MTKEAKELIHYYKDKFIFFVNKEGQTDSYKAHGYGKQAAINDLNNTIKALEEVNKDWVGAYYFAVKTKIDRYQQLLNEIQNEQ